MPKKDNKDLEKEVSIFIKRYADKELAKANAKLASEEGKNAKKEEKIISLKKELAKANAKLASEEKKHAKKEDEITSLEREHAKKDEEIQSLKTQLEEERKKQPSDAVKKTNSDLRKRLQRQSLALRHISAIAKENDSSDREVSLQAISINLHNNLYDLRSISSLNIGEIRGEEAKNLVRDLRELDLPNYQANSENYHYYFDRGLTECENLIDKTTKALNLFSNFTRCLLTESDTNEADNNNNTNQA